jgi:hypothetical protein
MKIITTVVITVLLAFYAQASELNLRFKQLKTIYNLLDADSETNSGDNTVQRSDDVSCILSAASCQFAASGKVIGQSEGTRVIFNQLQPGSNNDVRQGVMNCFKSGQRIDKMIYYCTVN